MGVLRDVGAGGGAGETKPTEPAWVKGVLKGRMPFCLAPHSCERGFPGDTTRRCRVGLDALNTRMKRFHFILRMTTNHFPIVARKTTEIVENTVNSSGC